MADPDAPDTATDTVAPVQVLTTSPLLFSYTGRDGRLVTADVRRGERLRLSSPRSVEIVHDFLDPRPATAPDTDRARALAQARDAGLLVSESEGERLSLWERHGWSRAAFLMFTQMNLEYLERPNAEEPVENVRDRRRAVVEGYEGAQPYPQPAPLTAGPALSLPEPVPVHASLSSLTSRRSVRAFAGEPDAQQLSTVLHAATGSLRALDEDRRSDDPLRLLNSFGSWAHLFVVVQRVRDLPSGVFEYDWRANRLLHAADAPSDERLLACVQGQRWALAGGFVVLLVADMRSYAWLYRHSRAYMHLLMQAGELAQELLMAATELGLGGWTTPALHESRVAELLGLPPDEGLEAISMVKLGRPAKAIAR